MFSSALLLLLALASISQCLNTETRSVTNLTKVVPTDLKSRHPTKVKFIEPLDLMYQVSVRHENIHICTGALVNPLYVITVAQCICCPPSDMEVALSRSADYNEEHSKVADIIKHEDYNPVTKDNDIAIIRLYEPLGQWNIFRHPILPKQDEHVTADPWVLYGYIPVDFNKTTTVMALHHTSVLPFDTDRCKILNPVVRDTNICAYDPVEPVEICTINMGGLLMAVNTEFGLPEIIGLAIWPKPSNCTASNRSMVFIQVSLYSNWIKTHINNKKYSDRYPYPGRDYWTHEIYTMGESC